MALSYAAGDEKVWFSMSAAPIKLYLRALLEADRLFALGIERIPHWHPTPAKAYAQLLEGKPLPEAAGARLALEDDVEADDAAVRAVPLAHAAASSAKGAEDPSDDEAESTSSSESSSSSSSSSRDAQSVGAPAADAPAEGAP